MPAAVPSALAQNSLQWAPPERIAGYEDSTWTPYLVADSNRTVHVFASMLLDGGSLNEQSTMRAVVYRQWTREGGWTQPNDILLPPIKQEARIQGALLDETGTIHVIFYAGDENEANIYYTQAPLTSAGSATAWSTPRVVGPFSNINNSAVLVSNRQGTMYIIYSGEIDGKGLFVTNSNDQGITWSDPMSLASTDDEELTPYDLQAYVDTRHNIHLVWTVHNKTGNTRAIYYATLQMGLESWSAPTEVEYVDDLPAGEPSIIEYNGELFLIHHSASPEGVTRFMRRSTDGGRTWSDKVRLFPHVGSNGPASLVIDSSNVLHMFFGNRVTIEGIINQGMWHSTWRDGRWTTPEAVVAGPSRDDFDPSLANAVVSQGNTILLTWMTDPGKPERGTFYSYAVLGTPEYPVTALPVSADGAVITVTTNPVAPTPTSENEPTMSPPATMVVSPTAWPTAAQPVRQDSPTTLLVLGLSPTILLIVLLVIAKLSR